METLSRLAVFGFPDPVRPWLAVLALVAALVGAVQLWNIPDPRRGLVYLVISQSGVALLAGLLNNNTGALSLTATAVALLLGGALIYLSAGHDDQRPFRTACALAGVAALAGAPATIGFLGAGRLYTDLIAAGSWWWLVLLGVLAAQAVLCAGLLYAAFWPGQPLEVEPALRAAYFGGLSLPAALLLLTAVMATVPSSIVLMQNMGPLGFGGFGSLAALVLVGLTLGGGYAIWHFDTAIRERVGGWPDVPVAALGRLDWLYSGVWDLIRGLGGLVDNLRAVIEGEGAILWALVVGVLVWLLLRQ
jgi:formate hydrogenlyase subunit 3/multisubunit Na+/H+ antiporter MnhD subunit